MAIPTLIPTTATLSDSVAQDHPHRPVGLGLKADETAFGADKFACQRMEADEPSPPKKVKREARAVETILKQTAEIGMVLVGMAALRGGAPPTPVECQLAVEAYTNLEVLVERVAPHDLVSKQSLLSLIQHFSLPQQPTSPLVSTPAPVQDVSPPTTRALAAPASVTRSKLKAKTTIPMIKARTTMPKIKTRTTIPKIKARTTIPKATGRPRGRPRKHPVTRLGVTRSGSTFGAGEKVEKGLKPLARVRSLKISPPSSDQRHVHQEIARAIHLSKPEIFLEALPETASAYVDSPIRCGTCDVLLNGTRSVLICDGCGTGFHLRCLKMYKHSDIPVQDWYCTKCVSLTGGRPRPAIYGPLRHGPGRRGSRTTWILKSPCEPQPTKASEYRLKLRNTCANEDGENINAVKALSAIQAAEDTPVESSSRTLET